MAYSGLGSGTQADPYQITTIAQFMEMNSISYTSTHYFLLMNDLDFISTNSFSLPNFGCNLDGGNYKLLNMNAAYSYFDGIYLSSNITIKNLSIYVNRSSSSSYLGIIIFNSSTTKTLSNFTITNTRVFVSPTFSYNYLSYLFNENITLDSSCVVNNLIIEGCFSYVLPRISCIVEYCYFNLYKQTNLFYRFNSTAIFRYCYVNILTVLESINMLSDQYLLQLSDSGLFYQNVIRIPLLSANSKLSLISASNSFHIENNLFITKKVTSISNRASIISNGYPSVVGLGLRYNFFSGNIDTPLYSSDKVFWNYGYTSYDNYITSNYYQKSKIVSNNPTDVAGKQVGLTDEQCLLESSFSGWDFTNVWQIGTQYPFLRNVQKPQFYYPDNEIAILCTRHSSSSVDCKIYISDESVNFGVEFYDSTGTNLLHSFENTININLSGLSSDITFIVKPYLYYNSVKIYQNTISYTHYYLDTAVSLTKVTSVTYAALQVSSTYGRYIHGSCMKGNYIYGSSRGDTSNNTNYCSIVKIPISNPNGFTILNIYGNSSNSKVADMDSLVAIGDYLYTVGFDTGGSTNTVLIKYNTVDDTYKVFKISTGTGSAYPSTTDGQYLYVYTNPAVIKIDVSIFNSTNQFNISSTWNSGFIYYYPSSQLTNSSLTPHTMVVDNDYLYIGFGTSSSTGQHEIHKIRKSDMTFVSKAFVPKMTDDMCQTSTHLFIGIELYDPTNAASFGYNWGTCAIRKSDMNVTKIPKLHSTQGNNQSYASLIFGNYLVDGRNSNGYIYVIDISDVDNWSLGENIGQRTVAAYQVYKTDGITVSLPVNEIFLTESGRFIGFGWSYISDVLSFDLPGVNFFAAPTVLSLAAHIVNNNQIQFSGNIFYNGGQSVTAQGFIISQNADLSGGTIYNCDSLADFTKIIDALPNGTYYWTAFAVNPTGQSAVNKKIFSFTKYNSRLKIVIGGQSFYSNNNQVYALKES